MTGVMDAQGVRPANCECVVMKTIERGRSDLYGQRFFYLAREGARSGRRAVFCRFSGCNLWSGLEKDRASANCNFCDDFVGTDGFGGGKFRSPDVLAETIERVWQEKVNGGGSPYVVFTGGEPALQIDSRLLCDLKQKDLSVQSRLMEP